MRLGHLPLITAVFAQIINLGAYRSQASSPPVSPLVVTPAAEELILQWRAPDPQFRQGPNGTVQVLIPGFSLLNQPGTPQLPFTTALVAIPPGTTPVLEIGQMSQKPISLPAQISLAPRAEGVRRGADGHVVGGAWAPAEEKSAFQHEPLELEPIGLMRGIQLARLVFYPVHPQGDSLQFISSLQATLRFQSEPHQPAVPITAVSEPFLRTLEATVINPQHLQSRSSSANRIQTSLSVAANGIPTAAMEVEHRGITAISYDMLLQAGFPLSDVNPVNLHLTRSGEQIPYQWEGDSDSTFEAGERLLFYADPRFSRWTDSDVYFLQYEDKPGLRMTGRSADPTGLPAGVARVEATFEHNQIYTPECYCAPIPPGRDGDRWVWDRLGRPGRPTASYSIELPDVDPGSPASLALWLIGYTDPSASPDHLVEVIFNDQSLGEVQWDGKQAVQATFSVPAVVLNKGINTLTLTLPGLEGVNIEGTWLDAFSVSYIRSAQASSDSLNFSGDELPHAYTFQLNSITHLHAYDVTQANQPVYLQNYSLTADNTISIGDPDLDGPRNYWITSSNGILEPTGLRTMTISSITTEDTTGADYLIITHPEFTPALEELIALRRSHGLRVEIVEVQTIYDVFGDGRPEPGAIRNYLAHAYTHWDLRPSYVLLVGDGTSDPKKYLDNSTSTFIPPYLADVDPWAGETASDNRYVTLEGDDNLPEMLIGRLPVNNLAEAQTVVAKIVGYETVPPAGDWSARALFVADNADPGGNFPVLTESLITSSVIPPWKAERLYYQPSTNTVTEIQHALLQGWNAGASAIMYTGHSSVHQWATERFFHLDDIPALTNGSRLPIILEMTCFTGSFQSPGFSTLDESLLRHAEGGAAAVWGPTGLGVATGHAPMAEGFLHTLFAGEQVDLGSAILAGKINLATTHPYYGDLIDTFTLLGDPALQLTPVSNPYSVYLPLIEN